MKNRNKSLIFWSSGFLLALILALIPSVAQANAGVPMIFLVFPPLTMAIFPIILIEAVVYAKSLNFTRKEALICSIRANLLSTLAGYPLLWIAIFVVGSVIALPLFLLKLKVMFWLPNIVLFPVWLNPAPNEQLLYLAPLSSFLFLVIAYFVSVFLEKQVIREQVEKVWHKPISDSQLKKSVELANLITYIPLAIFLPGFLYLRGLQLLTS